MKVKITKNALMNGLQMGYGIISPRSTVPILSNVLLRAEDKKLWLTTTDMEVSVRCAVEADVIKAGSSTIPARRLLSIIKELSAEEVEIEIDERSAASIKSGSAFFKVMGQSDDDFPRLPDVKGKFTYTIDQGQFKAMLNNVAYGASNDETRYVLNGVYLKFSGEKLTVVATDGRRLALAEHELEFPKEAESEMVIPSKAINELLHSLKDEGQLKICAAGNQTMFEFGDILVVSKLIEGSYPNYKQVIPAQSAERVPIEREALLSAVRRVALLTSEKSNSVKLTFTKNKLKVSVITPEVGEAHETMAVKYSGKDLSVAFNPEYLMDPLRHLTNDEIYLELTDEMSPGVVKCDQPFLYVLMPMRLN
ncbi:MAG: DNA polymerase III subunit beta [bacterium]